MMLERVQGVEQVPGMKSVREPGGKGGGCR